MLLRILTEATQLLLLCFRYSRNVEVTVGDVMNQLIAGLLASALVSPAAAEPAMTAVSVKGTGGWELICHVTTRSGDQLVEVLDGGHRSLSNSDPYNVSCDQTSGGSGPMVVTITGAACPFKGAAAGTCQQSFPHGPGSFVVRPKRP